MGRGEYRMEWMLWILLVLALAGDVLLTVLLVRVLRGPDKGADADLLPQMQAAVQE